MKCVFESLRMMIWVHKINKLFTMTITLWLTGVCCEQNMLVSRRLFKYPVRTEEHWYEMDQALFRILGILLLSQVAPKECHSTTGTFFKASNAIKGGSSDTPELDEGVFACERTKGCSIIGKLEGSSRYQAQANTDNDPSKFSSLLQKVDTEGNY